MAPKRKTKGPRKTEHVMLSLTNPIAKLIHNELSSRGLASARYQESLIKTYSEVTPFEDQWAALVEELKLVNRMEECEHDKIRAKYTGLRDFIIRLQNDLKLKEQDRNMAKAEAEFEAFKQQVEK